MLTIIKDVIILEEPVPILPPRSFDIHLPRLRSLAVRRVATANRIDRFLVADQLQRGEYPRRPIREGWHEV